MVLTDQNIVPLTTNTKKTGVLNPKLSNLDSHEECFPLFKPKHLGQTLDNNDKPKQRNRYIPKEKIKNLTKRNLHSQTTAY